MALIIPLDRIGERARTSSPRKVLRFGALAVPFALGWLARKVWIILALLTLAIWAALGWLVSAMVTGWQVAGQPRASEDGTDL